MDILPDQIYQHYRGNRYLIEGIATDTETGNEVVVYRALYGKCKRYVQTKERFLEYVEKPEFGYSGPRMTLVQIEEKI